MKIGELAKRTGLSVHTIRYYEQIGLLPEADRDNSGHRNYDASILIWIEFLERLKSTEMPIRTMLEYAELRKTGLGTEIKRCKILEYHRKKIRTNITELQTSLQILDAKIAYYQNSKKG